MILYLALSGRGTVRFINPRLNADTVDPERLNEEMVEKLSVPESPAREAVLAAMRAVPRHLFLPDHNLGVVYDDEAVVTCFEEGTSNAISSCSQPSLVASMLCTLNAEPGMKVLEIGAGTGYNAALIAKLSGSPERVWTINLDPAVAEKAKAALIKAGMGDVNVACADGWDGCAHSAPYGRIILTASAPDIAPAWLDQLSEGGLLVLPFGPVMTGQSVVCLKKENGKLRQMSTHGPCYFMRMRGSNGVPDTPVEVEAQGEPQSVPMVEPDSTGGEGPTSEDFQYFLILTAPFGTFGWFKFPGDDMPKVGLFSRELKGACVVFYDAPGMMVWGAEFMDALTPVLQHWTDLGKPRKDRLTWRVCKPGEQVDLAKNEVRVKRRWLDFILTSIA